MRIMWSTTCYKLSEIQIVIRTLGKDSRPGYHTERGLIWNDRPKIWESCEVITSIADAVVYPEIRESDRSKVTKPILKMPITTV